MRYLLFLALIGAAGYFGYENVSLKKEIETSRKELKETQAELTKVKEALKRRGTTGGTVLAAEASTGRSDTITKEISCPRCKGEGQYTVKDDRGHANWTGCALCGGTGGRKLVMPDNPDLIICPTCKGMGKVVTSGVGFSRAGRVSVTIDRRCNGKGYVLRKSGK